MTALEKKNGAWGAGYDLAIKEILSPEVLPAEIVKEIKERLSLSLCACVCTP